VKLDTTGSNLCGQPINSSKYYIMALQHITQYLMSLLTKRVKNYTTTLYASLYL